MNRSDWLSGRPDEKVRTRCVGHWGNFRKTHRTLTLGPAARWWRGMDKNNSIERIVLVLFLLPALYGASPARQPYIQVTPEIIIIDIDNVSLGDVLNNIQSKSGIGFDVPHSMRTQMIVAHVQAEDWKSALRKLLEDYSRIDVWEGDRLKTVYLLKSNISTDFFPSETPAAETERTKKKTQGPNPSENEILLTEDQARKLFAGRFRSPLPIGLLRDPELKDFLAGYGIENKEDLQDLKKAMNVRREARRQFQTLRKNARIKKK